MPGGWTMSMAWMIMPGQGALGAAAAFMAMWIVMMAAMMLPSLVPTLSNYRRALHLALDAGSSQPILLAGAAYFLVWTAFGILAYFVGLGLVALEMRTSEFARLVPIVTGIVVLLAGAIQFTEWKARSLVQCCETPACQPSWDSRNSWNYGLRLGMNCALCCFGFMAILLVIGVMDLRVMAIVSVAITIERLLPRPKFAVRAAGILMLIAGAVLILRALAN